jgi:hypothetical protein
VKCCSTQPSEKIVNKKSLATPNLLKHSAKHEQGKHIEEQVGYAPMHKYVRNQLEGFKLRRLEVKKAQLAVKIDTHYATKHKRGKQHNGVDNYQILNNWGDI